MAEIFDENITKKLIRLIGGDDKNQAKHEHYLAAVKHAEMMSWHVYGKKPEELLKRVRPREDPEITKYRLDSYEPITQSICKKAISITGKIFNSKLFSIRFDDDEKSQLLKKYTLEEYPRFNSIVNYLSNFSLKKLIADPNAIFLVQPYEYMVKGSERVMPIVTCYASSHIHLFDEKYVLLLDKCDEEKEWYYTYVDFTVIKKTKVTKKGKGIEVTLIAEYAHNLGELPLWFLGGEYSDKDYGLFESFFSPAVPFWNEAINDHSDVTGAYRMHMWPQKWEVADECEYIEDDKYGCTGGWIYNTEKGGRHTCPSCKGAGRKSVKSPYETYWVNRDKFKDAEGTANVDVPFGYVTVPVESTKMLEDKTNRNLEMGLNALAMDVVNKIGENQSGVSKTIDRTELSDFLQKVADQYFEVHLPNIYYYFVRYMFGVELAPDKVRELEPEISKPTQFDIYSTVELTKMFGEAKTAKLNASYLTTKQAEIQSREFQTNPELLQFLNLELKLDPLSEASRDDVGLMITNGTIKKETAVIHDNIKIFVQRALDEDKKFGEKDLKTQMLKLETYAKEVIESTKVKIDTSAIETPVE